MRRLTAACLVLCCCATVRPAIPSSLPSSLPPRLTVDGEIPGARISVEGMRIVLKRQEERQAAHDKEAEDLGAALRGETMRRQSAEKAAARNAWWGIYGVPIALGTGIGGAVVTALVFLLVIFRGGK